MKHDRETRSYDDIQQRVREAAARRREYLYALFKSALDDIVHRMASLGRRSQERHPLAAG